MTSHSSASVREHTPHVPKPSRTNTTFNALRQRAEAVLNDKTIDPQTRAIMRHAMEINDPWLARMVRRADAGQKIDDTIDLSHESEINEEYSSQKIEALVEIICGAGEQSAAALLVLMGNTKSPCRPGLSTP